MCISTVKGINNISWHFFALLKENISRYFTWVKINESTETGVMGINLIEKKLPETLSL